MSEQDELDGRRFGWLVIGGLTILWLVGVVLWLQSLWSADTYYARLLHILPNATRVMGWTLTFTLAVTWGGLLWMRYRRKTAPVPLLTLEALLELSPKQFEKHVASIFRHKGYRVRHRGRTGDHGVDLEVFPVSGRLGIVQCKRHRSTVGERVVRDLYGTMLHEGAAHAFLVTASPISVAATSWAAEKPMTLVDGRRLLELARELAR